MWKGTFATVGFVGVAVETCRVDIGVVCRKGRDVDVDIGRDSDSDLCLVVVDQYPARERCYIPDRWTLVHSGEYDSEGC